MMTCSTVEKQNPGKGQHWEGEKYFIIFTWGELPGQTSHEINNSFSNAQVEQGGKLLPPSGLSTHWLN